MNVDRLKQELQRDEGVRLKVYADSLGIPSIGVGRNLQDRGISEAEADFLLANDVAGVIHELDSRLPWYRDMNDARQRVLANMCFNLGINRLMGFTQTLAAMKQGRFEDAAHEMLNSRWANQVGDRARRLAKMMHTGEES